MATPRESREREIFLDALTLRSREDRLRHVRAACAGDTTLLKGVESLLAHHRTDEFLETAAVGAARARASVQSAQAASVYEPGMRIGRYRLIAEIGEGGAGIVFLAEQEEPVRREVALKVLKPGMDTRVVIARFESERQTLALMDHPNIARVFDAGTTEKGHPFFVMELVRGERLTDYCDARNLSTAARLKILLRICWAVEHAHQKGIIHRDLKPSNILVTFQDGGPIPKVIDFGIAKATQSLVGSGFTTQAGNVVGTPAYMSPEQLALGLRDVDTRSDVYSLGVLLYELLTGATAFATQRSTMEGWEQLRQAIRDRDPDRPSQYLGALPAAKLEEIARGRRTAGRALVREVRGDLDWIVLKALEKDKARRYATVGEFAQDLRRHLACEPIQARPPSGFYQFHKFVRRNRLAVASAVTLTLALMAGFVLVTWQFMEKSWALARAETAEREERLQRQRLQQANRDEVHLRELADAERLTARQQAYAADMNLVQQALAVNNLGRARALLDRHRPLPGQKDLRGWEWRYLWQFCQSDALFSLCQQNETVARIAVSPDRAWVALGGNSGPLSIWNLATRTEVASLARGRGQSTAAFSPTAPLLAYGASSRGQTTLPTNTVQFWTPDGLPTTAPLPLTDECRGLFFSTDGHRLLTATQDGQLTVWNVANARVISRAELRQGLRFWETCAATPDLALVAQAGNRNLRLLETATGEERASFRITPQEVRCLAFSPDGQRLALAGGIGESDIWILETATGRELARLSGHNGWVSSVVFSPDGRTLVSASADQTLRLWDLQNFRPAGALHGHQLEIWSVAMTADGTTLLSGSKDGVVNVWNATARSNRDTSRVLPASVQSWTFGPNPNSLITLERTGEVRRWNLADFGTSETLAQLDAEPFNVLLSPNGTQAAATGADGTVEVWSLDRLERTLRIDGPAMALGFAPQPGNLVTWHPRAGLFRQWEISTGKQLAEWSGGNAEERRAPSFGRSVASAAGKFLSLNPSGRGWVRDLYSGTNREFSVQIRQISGGALSPDGTLAVLPSGSGTSLLLSTETLEPVAELHGFLLGVHGGTFSPDGTRIALSSNGKEAMKLFSTSSQQELLTLEGEGTFFHAPAFSPDGRWLAAPNREGRLHLWQAPTFQDIAAREAATR